MKYLVLAILMASSSLFAERIVEEAGHGKLTIKVGNYSTAEVAFQQAELMKERSLKLSGVGRVMDMQCFVGTPDEVFDKHGFIYKSTVIVEKENDSTYKSYVKAYFHCL